MRLRVIVYQCEYCGALVGVVSDEKLIYYDDSDLTEHCSECMATVEDFRKIRVVEVEADTISEAIDKAIAEVEGQ